MRNAEENTVFRALQLRRKRILTGSRSLRSNVSPYTFSENPNAVRASSFKRILTGLCVLAIGVLLFVSQGVTREERAKTNEKDESRYRDPVTGSLRHGEREKGRAHANPLPRADAALTERWYVQETSGYAPVPRRRERSDEVGPPFQIGGEAIYGPAASDQAYPAVAFDGTTYLVVWEDTRGDTRDIYAARVSASGTVLDSSGIAISTAAYDQRSPAVAFDGTNYTVTWEDYRSGFEWDIYGARVDTSGTVLDTSGIPLSTAAADQRYPAVAFDGVNYLVAWDDLRGGVEDIYAARVDTSGTVRDTAGIAVSAATGGQYSPAVAFDGKNYFVVWDDNRSAVYDIYASRVDTSGTVLDPAGIAVSTSPGDQWYPKVEYDGTKYLVVWDDHRGSSWDIYASRVDTTGAVRDTGGIGIAVGAHNEYSPDLSFDGTNYFIAWDDARGTSWDIYGARVDTSGAILDPTGSAISVAGRLAARSIWSSGRIIGRSRGTSTGRALILREHCSTPKELRYPLRRTASLNLPWPMVARSIWSYGRALGWIPQVYTVLG